MTSGTDVVTAHVREELLRALDSMRAELDRVELLSAALEAFSKPVPDYEPGFQHLRHLTSDVAEIK